MKRVFCLFILVVPLLLLGCTQRGFETKGGWSGPAVMEDNVYVASQEGRLWALNKLAGTNIWNRSFPSQEQDPLGGVLYGAPAVDNDRVYFATWSSEEEEVGLVYAVGIIDGLPAWEEPFLVDGHVVGGPVLVGREQCVTADRGSVEGDVLLFGSTGGSVYALCAVDGSLSWKVETEGEIWASPVVEEGTVYVGSQNKDLYAISLDTGAQRWKPFKSGGAIVGKAAISDGKVFFGALDGKFYALNARSGTPVWREPFDGGRWFWAGAVADDERVYAVDTDGVIYGLGMDTGFTQWQAELGEMVISTPLLAGQEGNERLVVATKSGRISVRQADRGAEEWVLELTGPDGDPVKVKSSLGGEGGLVVVSTMDPWTVQALDLDSKKINWCVYLDDENSTLIKSQGGCSGM